jgi:hypothetical protein
MKKLAPLFIILFCTALVASEKEEPPLGYSLRLDKQTIRLVPGQEIQIPGRFENPRATLVPDKERLFTYGGVQFKYPASFSFEADLETEGIKVWTLDGNDFVITIHQYESEGITPKYLADELKKVYGAKTKTESKSYTFNGEKYSGLRVNATVAETKVIQDILTVPSKKGSRLLILQDHPPDAKVSQDESKLVLKLLNETLSNKEK